MDERKKRKKYRIDDLTHCVLYMNDFCDVFPFKEEEKNYNKIDDYVYVKNFY